MPNLTAEELVAATQAALPNARVVEAPSALARSPYPYVTAFLTPLEYDGPHVVVSDAEEWDETGVVVSLREDADSDFDTEVIPHDASAVTAYVRTLAFEAR